MSPLLPLSFPTASPKDVGAGGRGEENSLPGLENSLVLSKLGEGAQAGEGMPASTATAKGDSNELPLSCRFCPAPAVRAHLQSAKREQR